MMDIKSRITDTRIKAENIFIELSYEEYIRIAKNITENNPLQRRRVKSSNTVYSLLRDDLKKGCLIPPIVLALSNEGAENFSSKSDEEIITYILSNIKKLIILDGLQRTYTFLDVENELGQEGNPEKLQQYYQHKLRVELYLGINRFGILYRMLTLNTGQTPMSIRHQLEILYKDYLDQDINGVTLVSEVDNENIDEIGKYKFNDIIDGFNSYLERNELPIDRFELLNNIKGLEKLSVENHQKDLFKDFLIFYNQFVLKIHQLSDGFELTQEMMDEKDIILEGQPFGRVAFKIFNKSQPITGLGAALGKLKDFQKVDNFEVWGQMIDGIHCSDKSGEWLLNLISQLDRIKINSKKIGNSQRLYFYWFFRELFNEDSDSFLNLDEAVNNGYQRYRSQME